jgi:transcription elongation GreA/GreB family factor
MNGSESVDPAIISRVRALTAAVLHHNELARLSMKAMDRAASSSPTLSKVNVAAPNAIRGGGRGDAVQIVSSNAFIPSAGGCITAASPVARRLMGAGNPDVEEIMGGSRRSAIRSVNFNASIRET